MQHVALKWLSLLIVVLAVRPAGGQVLRGKWVEDAHGRIERYRKTDLHVIVLDLDGNPVPDVEVRLQMIRHDFVFGFCLDAEPFSGLEDPPVLSATAPLWRCFNAVSLEDATAWPKLQVQNKTWDFRVLDRMLEWRAIQGLRVRWGPVISADPLYLPGWVQQLDDVELRSAIESQVRRVLADYGWRVDDFDLHTHMADHQLVAARLGMQMVRHMHELGRATAPRTRFAARFEKVLSGIKLDRMLKTIMMLEEHFVPIDLIVLDEQVTGTVLHAPMLNVVERLGKLNRPVLIGRLEVGGPTPAAAALNLEALLYGLMAEPNIEGIFLGEVGVVNERVPHGALLNPEGELTPPGRIFDTMVRRLWWTDRVVEADELGNVRQRVFGGTYRLSAILPGEVRVTEEVYLPVDDLRRVVVLQPIPVKPLLAFDDPLLPADAGAAEPALQAVEAGGD